MSLQPVFNSNDIMSQVDTIFGFGHSVIPGNYYGVVVDTNGSMPIGIIRALDDAGGDPVDGIWVAVPDAEIIPFETNANISEAMALFSSVGLGGQQFDSTSVITESFGGGGTVTPGTHLVYTLSGGDVDSWAGTTGSVGGDYILRMESGEVALIPVEDLDMDNMFVDAPDAIANAIFAAPPVFDMFAAESQFNGLELAGATYDDGFGGQ